MKIAMLILGIIGFVFFTPLFLAYWLARFIIWIVQACIEKFQKVEEDSPKAED